MTSRQPPVSLQRALQLFRAGESEACEAECDSLLARRPASPEAWLLKARVAGRSGRQDAVRDCLQKAAELAPDNPAIQSALGHCLATMKQERAAIAALTRAVALQPENTGALQLLADLEARVGESQAATAHFEQLLRLEPANARAHYTLATLQPASADDPRVPRLLELLERGGHHARDRSRLAFALARLLDRQGRYAEAFNWMTEGNRLRLAESTFDLQRESDYVARAKQFFTPELYGGHRKGGLRDRLPVFVVGMPRSGSTLIEQVLASHPQIAGAGETMLLPDTVSQLDRWLPEEGSMPDSVAQIPPETWTALGNAYVADLRQVDAAAERIVDKQLFNYSLVGLIHLMLPEAKIIHCSRDPMATCFSCYMTAFRNDRGFTWGLEDLGNNYRLYRDIMRHWERVIPDAFMEVRYEDVVADLEGEARRMIEYLDLPWSSQCLEFFKTERVVRTSSQAQVRRPVYRSSLEHWKNYAPMLRPLARALAGETADDGL